MVEGLSGAFVHYTLSPYVVCVSPNELLVNARLAGVLHATRHAMYMHMNIWMSPNIQRIWMSPKGIKLCLVASRYIQRELGMALSTVAPDSDQFVDKRWKIVRHLCLQTSKHT